MHTSRSEDSGGIELSLRNQGLIQEEQFNFFRSGKKVSASLVDKNLTAERRFLLGQAFYQAWQELNSEQNFTIAKINNTA